MGQPVEITNENDKRRVMWIMIELRRLRNWSWAFIVMVTMCFLGIIGFGKFILLVPQFFLSFELGRIHRKMIKLAIEVGEIHKRAGG